MAGFYVAICAVVVVYNYQTPREWVLRVLAQKEGADVLPQTFNSAISISGFSNSLKKSNLLGSEDALNPNTSQSDAPANEVTKPATYQYKIVESADPCTLNKLGAQGWHPTQFGGTLQLATGMDETCKKSGNFQSLDWAFFEKEVQ